MARIYLGTQGWSYKDWVGPFYPEATKAADFLSVYAQHFDAVELDTTFYGVPTATRVDVWKRSTPDNFQFTAKLPRSITHDRRLLDARDELTEFVRVMSALDPKLGAVLIQMPPDFTIDEREALEDFLGLLPSSPRFALELRHRSWLEESTFELLERHAVAWTMIDLSYMPRHIALTTDFAYVRWLGNRRQIERVHAVQIDREREIEAWARELETVTSRVERLYGFFNNHYSGHSPANVRTLRGLLGVPDQNREPEMEQGTLL